MKGKYLEKLHERFTYHLRANWIDCELRAKRYPNARKIAEHFEVTEKTARRTIDFMRDDMRLPIDYSHEHRGFYYTEPAYAMTSIQMTEGELVTMLIAEQLMQAYKGTPIERQIENAFAKVFNALTEVVSIDLAALAEAHSFEAAVTSELDENTYSRLGRAAVERHRVEMSYYTATRGELSRRRVDPLHLRNYLGEWYLIAYDHRRNAPRDFHIGRIRELTVTDEKFDVPDGFNLDEYLDSGFGMIRGREPINVELIFDEYQARWIRERRRAHKTEEREALPDGRLRIRMQVTALDGVKRYIMQYGSHVEVIAPAELRESIRQEIEAMSAIYKAI